MPVAMMISTSSTPWSASISSTTVSTRSRLSGRRMGGSGRLRSSTAMVTFIPGRSFAYSGSEPSGWLMA